MTMFSFSRPDFFAKAAMVLRRYGKRRASKVTGFTLVELLVAVGLFSVVTSIAVGGFVSALRTQRQTAALISANSNVSLVIEQMAREMRTGFDFCTNGQICPTADVVSFKNTRSEVVTYCVENGAILRGVGGGSCGASNFSKITAENVNVQNLGFTVSGNNPSGSCDTEQPRITVTLGVSARETGVEASQIHLQTTVSVRLPLDC